MGSQSAANTSGRNRNVAMLGIGYFGILGVAMDFARQLPAMRCQVFSRPPEIPAEVSHRGVPDQFGYRTRVVGFTGTKSVAKQRGRA